MADTIVHGVQGCGIHFVCFLILKSQNDDVNSFISYSRQYNEYELKESEDGLERYMWNGKRWIDNTWLKPVSPHIPETLHYIRKRKSINPKNLYRINLNRNVYDYVYNIWFIKRRLGDNVIITQDLLNISNRMIDIKKYYLYCRWLKQNHPKVSSCSLMAVQYFFEDLPWDNETFRNFVNVERIKYRQTLTMKQHFSGKYKDAESKQIKRCIDPRKTKIYDIDYQSFFLKLKPQGTPLDNYMNDVKSYTLKNHRLLNDFSQYLQT